MSKGEFALKLVKPWVDKIGPEEARRRLYVGGISYSAADQLVRGSYPCVPGFRISKIIINEAELENINIEGGQAS
jgi:hypothetical protein